MAATRTMTKQEWRRTGMANAAPPERFSVAYDWLRAALVDLPKRRDPDSARRAHMRTLGPVIMRDAATYLAIQATGIDRRLPLHPSDIREIQRRGQMQAALREAATEWDQMRRACDWFRSSAAQLRRRSHVPSAERQMRLVLRDEVMAAAAEHMAQLAERTERGD
jgi:hypothetical protein